MKFEGTVSFESKSWQNVDTKPQFFQNTKRFFWGGGCAFGDYRQSDKKQTNSTSMAFQIGPLEPSRSGPSKAMGFWENEIRPLLFFCGAKNGIFPRLFMVFFVHGAKNGFFPRLFMVFFVAILVVV